MRPLMKMNKIMIEKLVFKYLKKNDASGYLKYIENKQIIGNT